MIGTVENKLCTTSYQAKLTDNKPVIIYRIMIEHVVFLKVSRIIHKVIVDGKVSDLDCRARDNRFQIYCLNITGAGIYFVFDCFKARFIVWRTNPDLASVHPSLSFLYLGSSDSFNISYSLATSG